MKKFLGVVLFYSSLIPRGLTLCCNQTRKNQVIKCPFRSTATEEIGWFCSVPNTLETAAVWSELILNTSHITLHIHTSLAGTLEKCTVIQDTWLLVLGIREDPLWVSPLSLLHTRCVSSEHQAALAPDWEGGRACEWLSHFLCVYTVQWNYSLIPKGLILNTWDPCPRMSKMW